VADLFSGAGGLTLGLAEACRALELEMVPTLAMDLDLAALETYGKNFPTAKLVDTPVEEVLQPFGAGKPSSAERELLEASGQIDVLVGGPPCQGHSDLNNHTRRSDPKNELYATMARFCEIARPRHVVIENVPGVVRDRSGVAQRTWAYLEELGYSVSAGVIDASIVGTAQQRKRSITLASLDLTVSVPEAEHDVSVQVRPLRWAIGDLRVDDTREPFDTPSQSNDENTRRIDHLFENDLFDLPDSERPDCHRLKNHSYVSMYGRLHWNRPAPTVTTGFGSMGRGRWVHPAERRLITPHEAARIQGIPDFFDFNTSSRTHLHKVIGNAVPPKLGYAAGIHLLR
jgi:DNA (cytosine-5)-methyltransferase 1